MTLLMGRRQRTADSPLAPVDLADDGIHRDPTNHDPIARGSFTQRLAHKASAVIGAKTSRRSFLTRTAVLGSALAVGPIDFILKPGTAYGYLCGTCSDGWTAFCCTINNGSNTCPPSSFVAGWWKADNAAYCCGAARYILDCNATCPTQCSCRCSGASCDGRKTCCAQFRYGQCHTEIACYGPVVCRIATCTPPWQYDPSCTTTSATDNRTRDHGAPCIAQDCDSAISKKYAALGGAGGFLGNVVSAEAAVGDGKGRRARYQGGNVYWTTGTGAHEVHGSILSVYGANGGPGGIGYPTTDETVSSEGGRYSAFEQGLILFRPGIGCFPISGPFLTTFNGGGGVNGPLGYPRSDPGGVGGVGYFQTFDKGQIWLRGGPAITTSGILYDKWRAIGAGPAAGYPTGNAGGVAGRAFYQDFDRARIYAFSSTKVVAVSGQFNDAHQAQGGAAGSLGLPVADPSGVPGVGYFQNFDNGQVWLRGGAPIVTSGLLYDKWRAIGAGPAAGYPTGNVGGVAGRAFYQDFDRARIYAFSGTKVLAVSGQFHAAHQAQGGAAGSLGLPVADAGAVPGVGYYQDFDGGRIWVFGGNRVFTVSGLFAQKYAATGGGAGPLGYPTAEAIVSPEGRSFSQSFDNGRIHVLSGTALYALTGPVQNRYVVLGGPTGTLGLPASDPTPAGDGRGTFGSFAGGRIYTTPTTGAWEIQNPILSAWMNSHGGPTGSLGYPTGPLLAANGGTRDQRFERGGLRRAPNGTVTKIS